MSSLVMNFLVHGPVGRLEASLGEPEKRTWPWKLRRLQVVRDAYGSSGALRGGEFGLPRPAMFALLRRMEAFFWTLLPVWSISCCMVLRTGLSRLGLFSRLSFLSSRLDLGLFGRPSFLSCLPSRLPFRLLSRPLSGSLGSPLFRLRALPVALLFLAALFLQLVAFGHPAHRIQSYGQGLHSHPPCRQALLATGIGGPHGHHPS